MRPCESVENLPLPCESYGSFKLFKIPPPPSDFGMQIVYTRFCACAYEFLTNVTKSMVHSVHKVVIRSCFAVIWRQQVSQGIGHFI